MPKGINQKIKLVCLQHILLELTDDEHPLTLNQLAEKLEAHGIEVRDRKSLVSDLETLEAFGVDVQRMRVSRAGFGYYVGARAFELAELKLLVDAVQSSRFITHKKTAELIRKVEGLASVHQARQLQRQVFVSGRIKNMNESIYYTVDAISAAIAQGLQISFVYYEWVLRWGREKIERAPRRQGEKYTISPWALCWEDENYYLVGLEAGKVKHFRVDKMADIGVINKPREGGEQMRDFDIASYSKTMFGMFGGNVQRVTIEFAGRLIGVVADRFGADAFLSPAPDGRFSATVEVAVSPQFLSWIIGFGGEAKVTSPDSVANAVCDMARAAMEKYV